MRPIRKRNQRSSSSCGWVGRRPDDLAQDVAAQRPLHGEIVQLVGRRLDPHAQPEPLGQLLEVDAVVLVAADEAEVVRAEPEDGASSSIPPVSLHSAV